jgi:dihydroflavonol-4-reductase
MKVLVTGASGFIGGNLARELLRQGYQVRAMVRRESNVKYLRDTGIELIEGDLLDKASLKKALHGCEALFHAAAIYTFWSRNPELIYQTNVQGTENILEAAKTEGIKKVVFTSSESTVGINKGCTGTEEGKGCLEKIPGDYKKSKFMAENLAFKMSQDGLPLVIVNPTTPIGPYDIKPTPTGGMVVAYLNGNMFACVNTGLNIVDVEDVAKGHILALEKGRSGERYLLGNKNLTFREIMLILERISGIKAPRVNIPTGLALGAGYLDEFFEGKIMGRNPHVPVAAVKASRKFRHFDCSKAVSELGLPQTPVEIAFEKAVNWFRQNGYVK